MSFNANQGAVTICDTIFDSIVLHTAESDLVIPDYLPDAVKVLRCDTKIIVKSEEVISGRLEITGFADSTIIYVSEESIKSLDCKTPFTMHTDTNNFTDDMYITTYADCDNANVRLYNSRKINVKVKISVAVKCEKLKQAPYMSPECNDELNPEMKTKEMEYSKLLGIYNDDVIAEEDIEIPKNLPEAAVILSNTSKGNIEEVKMISDKLLVKGSIMMSILYCPSDNTVETAVMDYVLPFNKIMDIDGIDDNCFSKCMIKNISVQFKLYENEDGENRIMSLYSEFNIMASVYKQVCEKFVVDAFMPGHESNIQKTAVEFEKVIDVINVTEKMRGKINFESEVISTKSCAANASIKSINLEGKQLTFKGVLSTGVIAELQDSSLSSMDSESEFEVIAELPDVYKNIACSADCNANVNFCEAMNDGQVEIACDITVNALIKEKFSEEVIEDFSFSEEKAVFGNHAMTLYYPEVAESYFDIAKKYGVKVSKLMDVNNAQDDVCKSKYVMIVR